MPFPVLAIPALIEAVKTVIDRVVPDKAAAEKAKAELDTAESKAAFENALAQIAVNMEEAKSTRLLVAGWRPACGWIGAFALGYAAVLEPMLRFGAQVLFDYRGAFPVLDTTITMQILFGILGLGAYRTAEFIKNGRKGP
jgi:hypothetical protein